MIKITKQNIIEKYYKYNNLIPDDYCRNIADFVAEYYNKFVKLEMIEILWYLLDKDKRLIYNEILVKNLPDIKFDVTLLDIPVTSAQKLRLTAFREKLSTIQWSTVDFIHVTHEFLNSWDNYLALDESVDIECAMSLKYEFIFKQLIRLFNTE